MKAIFKIYVYLMTTVILGLSGIILPSCSADKASEPKAEHDGEIFLILNVLPLSSRSATSDLITEKISSLRIVVIDMDNGLIENNHYVPFNGNGNSEPVPVSNFEYYYTLSTKAGQKRLYLIANESYVGQISYQPAAGVTLPEDLPSSLTEVLDSEKFMPGLDSGAQEFIDILDAIYFNPNYNSDTDNDIFIPYISSYDENTSVSSNSTAGDKGVINWTTYIVPVSTKFTFRFRNYRPFPVYVENISLSKINDLNFLIARVGPQDFKKSYSDTEGNTFTDVYWVDWLARISQLSQNFDSYYPNMGFNELYGWISDYSLPNYSTPDEKTFFSLEPGNGIEIPKVGVDEITPGEVVFGPYYLAESRNMVTFTEKNEDNQDVTVTRQQYNISVTLNQDNQPNSQIPDFTNVNIENLQALFRNTNVVININMYQGDVEVYAEIKEWSEKFANGWVVKQ